MVYFASAGLLKDSPKPGYSSMFAAYAQKLPSGEFMHLTECGSLNNSCEMFVAETGIFGKTRGLEHLLRKLAATSCYSAIRSILEKHLQAENASGGYGTMASIFIYERDAAPHIDMFIDESKHARAAMKGMATISIICLAEELGVKVKFRVNFCAAPDNDGFWEYTPTKIADEFFGTVLHFWHTGGWHWKLGTIVSAGGAHATYVRVGEAGERGTVIAFHSSLHHR
jgi:hypothetical protein